MRNLLAFVAAVTLTFAGVGWYLGWYQVEDISAAPGHKAVHIDIDGAKIGDDLHRGGEKLQEALDRNLRTESSKRADGPKAGDSSQKRVDSRE